MNFTPALRIPEYGGKHGPSIRKPPEGKSPTGGTEKKKVARKTNRVGPVLISEPLFFKSARSAAHGADFP